MTPYVAQWPLTFRNYPLPSAMTPYLPQWLRFFWPPLFSAWANAWKSRSYVRCRMQQRPVWCKYCYRESCLNVLLSGLSGAGQHLSSPGKTRPLSYWAHVSASVVTNLDGPPCCLHVLCPATPLDRFVFSPYLPRDASSWTILCSLTCWFANCAILQKNGGVTFPFPFPGGRVPWVPFATCHFLGKWWNYPRLVRICSSQECRKLESPLLPGTNWNPHEFSLTVIIEYLPFFNIFRSPNSLLSSVKPNTSDTYISTWSQAIHHCLSGSSRASLPLQSSSWYIFKPSFSHRITKKIMIVFFLMRVTRSLNEFASLKISSLRFS